MNLCLRLNAVVVLLLCYVHGTTGQQHMQIIVERRIKGYGQNLTLFCMIENCCQNNAGWNVGISTLFIDIKEINPLEGFKDYPTYRATYNAIGIRIVIQNFSQSDLNKTHECVNGYYRVSMTLLYNDVFSPIVGGIAVPPKSFLPECVHGRFGQTCQFRCHCLHEAGCNPVDGSCPHGHCAAGWQLNNCSKECDPRKFGQSCRFKCNCLTEANCNSVDGSCPRGHCADGWQLNNCSIECAHGRFGPTCQFKCNCLKEAGCNPVDGTCPHGHCAVGWQLNNCSKEKPFLDMSTGSNTHREFTETPKETGLSFQENFYFGLLAVGLVLVLFLSIICNACINRKCKTVVTKTTQNVQRDSELNAQANHIAHVGRFDNDFADYISHYETINENEMLPKHVLALITDVTDTPKHRSSAPDKLYLEKGEDELKQKRSKEPDIELHVYRLSRSETLVDTKETFLRESNLDSNTDTEPTSQVEETLESDGSSNGSEDITCSNTDGYLHPYTALNSNDMEYLNIYSSVTNVEQAICVEPLNLGGSDSWSCLKNEITQDGNVVGISSCRRFNGNDGVYNSKNLTSV